MTAHWQIDKQGKRSTTAAAAASYVTRKTKSASVLGAGSAADETQWAYFTATELRQPSAAESAAKIRTRLSLCVRELQFSSSLEPNPLLLPSLFVVRCSSCGGRQLRVSRPRHFAAQFAGSSSAVFRPAEEGVGTSMAPMLQFSWPTERPVASGTEMVPARLAHQLAERASLSARKLLPPPSPL